MLRVSCGATIAEPEHFAAIAERRIQAAGRFLEQREARRKLPYNLKMLLKSCTKDCRLVCGWNHWLVFEGTPMGVSGAAWISSLLYESMFTSQRLDRLAAIEYVF